MSTTKFTNYARILDDEPPTKICTICNEKKDPKVNITITDFWLCPGCLSALKDIVLEYKNRQKISNNMKKYQHE